MPARQEPANRTNGAAVDAVRIEPLTSETWPALAALFEEGGDPRWCWCQFWRVPGTSFTSANAEGNREGLRGLVGRPIAPGLVALDVDGRAIGWVGLGPREDFERLERSRVRPRLDDVPVWSIVCFVVSRRARRRGIAARLLDAAVEYARSQGAPALEAYPVDTTEGRPTAATLYTGPLSTFLRAGFIVAREVASPRATVTRTIVRLDLTGDARSATTVDTSLGPRLDSASGAVRAIRPAHEEAHSE